MKKQKEDSAHSEFGPSSLERTMECTASVVHNRSAPPEQESVYSKEGTDAHDCYEAFNRGCMPPNKTPVGKMAEFLSKKYPIAMVIHAQEAFMYTATLLQSRPGALFFAEEKVDISHFTKPGEKGTLDAAIVEEFGRLIILDYKYGAGVLVSAERNIQLIAYALAMAKKFDYNFVDVEMVVIQPRAPDEDGKTVRSWICGIEELMKYEKKIQKKVKEAESPKAKFKHGDHCRFCRGRVTCPEISKVALREAQIEFDDNKGLVSLNDPVLSKVKNLSVYLKAADKLEAWVSSVRKTALFALMRGEKLEGWKLVRGRATKKYLNAEKTEREAKQKFGPKLPMSAPELLTPHQLELAIAAEFDAKFAKKWVEQRIAKVSTTYMVAPEDDPREAVSTIEDDFGEKPIKKGKGQNVKEEKEKTNRR